MITQKQVGKTYTINNLPSGGVIGIPSDSVDNARQINVTQTTAGQFLSLPDPTDIFVSYTSAVVNTGTVPFTLLGFLLPVGAATFLAWNAVTFRWSTDALLMGGATAVATGSAGYVPAPGINQQDYVLYGDGAWDSSRVAATDLFDFAAGGNLNAAQIDGFSLLRVAQTTPGQTITIGVPTSFIKARLLYISNTGTASFAIGTNNISPGTASLYLWGISSAGWQLVGPPSLITAASIAFPNFPASGPIGTAAATVDAASTFTINQTTALVSVTLPAPTSKPIGSSINLLNVGTSNININGSPATPQSTLYFVWNGTTWAVNAPSIQLTSPDTTKSISIANDLISFNGPLNLGSTYIGNVATTTTLPAPFTIDVSSLLLFAQTTPSVSATLPTPTSTISGRLLTVANLASATTSILVNGVVLAPGKQNSFVWDGAAWDSSSDSVAMTGSTAVLAGVGGMVTTPAAGTNYARLHGDGTWKNTLATKPVALANFAANAAIGTAALTVDIADSMVITQTTASISLTLPNPTDVVPVRNLEVFNAAASTQTITVAGAPIAAGSKASFSWSGTNWLLANSRFTGATATTAGVSGPVPAPAIAQQDFLLYGDGTWVADRMSYTSLADFPAGGTVTTAQLDSSVLFKITQTTASQTLSLGNPTASTTSRSAYIANSGSVSFAIGTNNLAPGAVFQYAWVVGSGWTLVGLPSLSALFPLSLANFTASGSIGTASLTVDSANTFTLNQTTALIAVTIPSPTFKPVGSSINFLNTGTAEISINGNPATPQSTLYFVWNGTAWVADAPGLQLSSPDNTKLISITNNLIALNGPINEASASLGNIAATGTLPVATSVDISSLLLFTQTTASVLVTLPSPTTTLAGRRLTVANKATATTSISVNGIILPPGKQNNFVWDGAAWNASSDAVAMTGSTAALAGVGGAVPTPVAGTNYSRLHGDGTWKNIVPSKVLAITNFAASGVLGTAATTVDLFDAFSITQTTAAIIVTLPSPTDVLPNRVLEVFNAAASTQSITVVSTLIAAGSKASFSWSGTAWVTAAVTGTANIPNSPSSTTAPLAVANLATGGNIGTALLTVDVNSAALLTQTTSGQTVTLPSPTAVAGSRLFTLSMATASTASVSFYGQAITAGQSADAFWNGTAWTGVGVGQNVLAEFGGQTFTGGSWSSSSFTALSATVPATGSQITLPSAGTWLVTGQLDVSGVTSGAYQMRLFNVTSGLIVGQATYMSGDGTATTHLGSGTINAQVVTVSAGTIIRIDVTSNSGGISSGSGGSIYYQKIGGFAPVTGQTAESLSISKAGNWLSVGVQTFGAPTGSSGDFNSITNASAVDMSTPTIVFNTGAFTLTATGLTCVKAGRYNFKYSLTVNTNSAAAMTEVFFTKNNSFASKYALTGSRQFTTANQNPETTSSFFTDTCVVGDTYQLRVADVNTTATGFISAYAVDVQQIGTSALVGITSPSTSRVTTSTTLSVLTGQSVVVLVDASSAAVTITLPLASSASNSTVQIKKIDSSANLVTVARSGTDTIDGATSYVGLNAQYKANGFAADSSNSFWGIF